LNFGRAARQRTELAGLDKGASLPAWARIICSRLALGGTGGFPARVGAHGRRDLHLVGIETRGGGMSDFHVIMFWCIAHDPTPVELRLTGDGWRQARLWG